MAIITYECDICKRQVDIKRNIISLEVMNRCIITQNCRGKLLQKDIQEDYVRGRTSETIAGLDNWFQRKALHNHTQQVAKNVWTIKHDMGGNPSVQVFVNRPTTENPDNRIELIPENIIITNSNEIQLEFNRSESGVAQLVARTSDPLLIFEEQENVIVPIETTQISSNGTITIATKNINPLIEIEIIIKKTDGTLITLLKSLDYNPSVISPWQTINKVIIKNKQYLIRSLDIRFSEILTESIPNGSFVSITKVNNISIGGNEVFFLMSKEPYSIYDRIFDRTIDAYKTNTLNTLYYNSSEWTSYNTIIDAVYPLIKII